MKGSKNIINWLTKNWKMVLVGLVVVLLIPVFINIYRRMTQLFSFASLDAEELNGDDRQDAIDSMVVNTNLMTLSQAEVDTRAMNMLEAFNAFWGTDEKGVIAQLLHNPQIAYSSSFDTILAAANSAGGSISLLNKHDLRAIIKSFGLRAYSNLNGGSPSILDDLGAKYVFGLENLDLAGWVNKELNDYWRGIVVDIFERNNANYMN